MNMQTTITAAAPFPIGAGFSDNHGRAWIVKVEPVDTQGGLVRRSALIIGGPSPMAEIRWNITVARESGTLSRLDEHTTARKLAAAPIPACPDPAALLAECEAKAEKRRQDAREASARADAARNQAKADVERYAPAWAKAAIVAELYQDDSDSMTDYFNHKTLRTVVIGWSRHTRDLFPELRKAAATFPETADLADAPESAEHREKYSMGAGFYLKRGWRDSSGWCVKKRSLGWLANAGLEFSDAAKGVAPAPTVETAAPAGGDVAGMFRLSKHIHTKKGFDMWIVELAERIERHDFDRFLASAKALGGWYSRAWAGTPAGFAFKSEAKARQFIGCGDPEGGAPIDGNGQAPAARAPSPIPAASPADKLRAMADSMQAAIDDKFRDRRANTPKQQRQAAEARQDGVGLERAQRIMRALADRHAAGTVPECLQRVTTKAEIVRLAKEEIDRSNAGYYDAGFPTGRPYAWREAADIEKAAAAWALLDTAGDTSRRQAEELRQKLEALKFAKIPGYFPTPADLVAQMIEAADLPAGARVLEPSAGSGAIADILREAGHNVECVERHASLRDILQSKGHNLIASDFLELSPPPYPAELFDAVLMNPPFEGGQDCEHVARAWAFVKPGGVLVAIMGAGVTFQQRRPYSTFRAWVEEQGGEFVDIPAGAFKESGTGVASVMLTMRKEEEEA